MTGMTDVEMAAQLVAAAEAGFPGNRNEQLARIAQSATRLPMGFTGAFLLALQTITERAMDEQPVERDDRGER